MRGARALFWATTVASAAPLLATKYLPFTDLPEHVAAIATLARLFRGAGDGTYEIAFGKSQYLLYDIVGALVTLIVGDAALAHHLVLVLVAVLWPVSLRALLVAMDRDERTAIFAPMVFWNRALVLGFMPFVGSVPLCFFGLALVVRQCRAPRRSQAVLLAGLAVALFYTHVSAWVIFVVISAGLGLTALADRWSRFSFARAGALLLPLLPSVVAAFVWWRAGSLTTADGSTDVHRMSVVEKVGALTVWTFDAWKTHVDEVCSIAWWGAFAVVVVRSGVVVPHARKGALEGSRVRSAVFVAVPLVATLFLYFVTPFGVGTAAYLDVRLAPLVVLTALVVLVPKKDLWGSVPLSVAACATMVYAADAAYEIRRCADEALGDLDGLLANLPPGKRLVTLNFEPRGTRVHYFPYIYAGSYHRVPHEAVAYYSFTEMAHWPIHFVRGKRPKASLFSLGPCGYWFRRDGEYFDYVLIQGEADPFAATPVGPVFRSIATSGRFTLFAKTEPEGIATLGQPDRPTCPRGPGDTTAIEP